jgi:glycosyltransferase involved in cell wall biosynthesis
VSFTVPSRSSTSSPAPLSSNTSSRWRHEKAIKRKIARRSGKVQEFVLGPDGDLVPTKGDARKRQTNQNKLREMAAANPRIIYLGQRSSEELASLYEHCLACIVPSIYYETGPFVVIEAFARKAPVIAHDMAGMSELVRESGGGILYRTHEELLAALSRIAGSPSLREQLGENGYRAFQLRWSRPAHLEMYFGLLREVALRKFGFVPWEAERDGESAG